MSFLGVDASLTGRRWVGPGVEVERATEVLVQQTSLPLALCQVLARRGVAAEEAEAFLAPSLRDLLPDPRSLRDMEKAATRFLAAVKARQRIAVFADYDVDGGSSAALLLVWLREMGCAATLYVPDRIDEGYGLTAEGVSNCVREHQPNILLAVDCGSTSFEVIQDLQGQGIDVIVLDHHQVSEPPPPAQTIVNPQLATEDEPDYRELCSAGLAFKL
ncbi:DHH family phosphoesterase, partial [uncultured Sulfitobacter sp.]|uniref:DHH family phosphoesterase n=1 Tax=uncultured Sulfitobacter sp. TaxID=191468 RepID=UPI0025928EBF